MQTNIYFETIKLALFVLGGVLAIIQYWSANAFKRSQYLSELWRKFYTTPKLTEIFQALERKDTAALREISEADIYLYLAYLEEVVIFRKKNWCHIYKINDSELLNLFQFHFYHIYQAHETREMFWSRIIEPNEIEAEIKSAYWKQQYDFSLKCKTKIENML